MMLHVSPHGDVHCLYGEAIDLASLGEVSMRRASHVDPDEQGQWHADLSPVGGPLLGPYPSRSMALGAEIAWLEARLGAIALGVPFSKGATSC